MQKTLTPAERLIVAADFKPIPPDNPGPNRWWREWVKGKVLSLADSLKGTGVCLKVNSALRACGYDLIGEIQSRGLRVFADLKLIDIGETLSTDGVLIRETKPEMLTVVCAAGSTAMTRLKKELPDTEVLAVTVLTTFSDDECKSVYRGSRCETVIDLADLADRAGADGLICSAAENEILRERFGNRFTLNNPAVRPEWAIVPGDDQNPELIMTPTKAVKTGGDRFVIGRPIVKAANPREAVMRTIEEIALATA